MGSGGLPGRGTVQQAGDPLQAPPGPCRKSSARPRRAASAASTSLLREAAASVVRALTFSRRPMLAIAS